jgi:hypothetical protein
LFIRLCNPFLVIDELVKSLIPKMQLSKLVSYIEDLCKKNEAEFAGSPPVPIFLLNRSRWIHVHVLNGRHYMGRSGISLSPPMHVEVLHNFL